MIFYKVVPEDHVHEYELTKVLIAPTCKTDGEGIYSCACGNAEDEVRPIPASEEYHAWGEPTQVGSFNVYVCSICNNTKVEEIEGTAHVHNYVVISEIPATCTSEGKITKQCQSEDEGECDQPIITETVAMIPHESDAAYGTGFVIRNAEKCGQDGEEIVTCKICNQQFTRAIPAHSYDDGIVSVEPTCTTAGTMKYTCKDCGATKTEEIKALGHDLQDVEVLVPATCEKTGLAEKVCKRCGYEEKTVLKALGHAVKTSESKKDGYINEKGEVVEGVNPDPCKYDTVKTYDCDHYNVNGAQNLCNLKDGKVVETVKKATGHAIDTSKEVREGIATIDLTKVVEDGVYKYDIADKYLKDENGNIVFEKGVVVDCSHEKVKIFTCANCGKTQTVVVEERKAHTGAVTTKPATCEDYGYTSTSCTVCNKVVLERTAEKPVGHNYVYNVETCTTPAVIKCTRCNDELTVDEISTLNTGSDNTLKEKITKLLKDAKVLTAEQTLANFTAYNPAKGHNFVGKLTVDKEDPTKGTSYCDRCGKNIQVDITLDVDKEQAEEKITVAEEENTSETEKKVNKKMDKVNITFENNVVTIKLNQKLTNDDIDKTTVNSNCFGIMLDLGIKAENVEIVRSSGTYSFNPDGTDTNTTEMKRWNDNATENSFMVWLSPEDFQKYGGSYEITFADSKNPSTYPITITFVYDTSSVID